MSMSISGNSTMQAPQAWSGASMKMPPQQKMASLFDKIDTAGAGTISKSQLEQSLQSNKAPSSFQSTGIHKLWSQLDPSGTGQVSKQDFSSKMAEMQAKMPRQHHHHSVSTTDAPQTPQTAPQTPQTAAQSAASLTNLGGNPQTNSMVSSVVNLTA